MIAALVAGLMASSTTTAPNPPTSASLSTYSGSLVEVDWVNANAGSLQTRVYKKRSGGAWTLLTTVTAGVALYQTGLSSSNGYIFGVSHYNPVTGYETSITTAANLPPNDPTNVTTSLYSGAKIQVNFDASALYSTRCYKSVSGVWTLVTTLGTGVSAWSTGLTSGAFAVSHYDSATGLESNLVEPA